MRTLALEVMHAFEQFRPYLAGPVLKGTAGRYGEIDLQLFTDDCKAVELFLLNRGISYDVSDQRHYNSDQVRAVSVLKCNWSGVPINLAVYALRDERSGARSDALFPVRQQEHALEMVCVEGQIAVCDETDDGLWRGRGERTQ